MGPTQMANGQQENSQRAGDELIATNGQGTTAGDVLDEEQLEKAMKTLKEMHIQVGP